MRNLKELMKLITKNQALIGEEKSLCFVDLEGNEHALSGVEMVDEELVIKYGPYETVVTHEDLSTIEFNGEFVEGMDVDNEPWKIVFEEFGSSAVDEETVRGEDVEDEDYNEPEDIYNDGIDDDNNILTSDDY